MPIERMMHRPVDQITEKDDGGVNDPLMRQSNNSLFEMDSAVFFQTKTLRKV